MMLNHQCIDKSYHFHAIGYCLSCISQWQRCIILSSAWWARTEWLNVYTWQFGSVGEVAYVVCNCFHCFRLKLSRSLKFVTLAKYIFSTRIILWRVQVRVPCRTFPQHCTRNVDFAFYLNIIACIYCLN